ncbi:ferredoxin-thioredoxin reductase catalytic domain-containing protein [Desulforhopalus singaporensis]|uniref:ferredoxin:thioredoxin reductase n=1 Tax=Desulforhopalus singaporensis TaxID=91360 RepID=A0A1H0IWK5_9BACT|nr:ferredoxin-thioredoxin reductase catalytic domain-containing protein [Desulforhopalus singaporensis]SDO35722.1 Ferredoxin-thioredoxin reductase, catalytic subunit [Desulforhopalus singaporensis]
MDAHELYGMLKDAQERQGYFFNRDDKHTFGILDGLLINKERYGYMACPCRLASGIRENDSDIICPCDYREEDVREFGSCYCTLYVSGEFNEGKLAKVVVPERRPPEKVSF